MAKSTSYGSILPALLTTLFVYLKLTHQIDWSWWWVTAPLWAPFALAVVIALVLIPVALVVSFFSED